ncbi:mucin-3A-like [Xenopus tropicalis]|uniref:Mucin-3A-like n=1 Tax=Xenopus tropicalis TaxID=8364 RepID=A0A8J1ITS4_XENTR|nr:mucin-3A-like [Xenopus tropicalis]
MKKHTDTTIQPPLTKHSVSVNNEEKYLSAVITTQKSSFSTGIQSTSNSYLPLSAFHKTTQPFLFKTMILQSTEENIHTKPTSRAKISYVTRNVTHLSRTSNRNTVPPYPTVTIIHLLSNITESSSSTGSSYQSSSNSYSPLSAIHKTKSQLSALKTTISQKKHSEPVSRSEVSYVTINATRILSTSNKNMIPFYPTMTIRPLLSNSTEKSSSTGSSSMSSSNSYSLHSAIQKTVSKPSSLKTTIYQSTEENKHSELTSRAEISYFTMNTTDMLSASNTVPSYPTVTFSHLLSNNTRSSFSTGSSSKPSSNSYSPLSAIHKSISLSSSLKTTVFQRSEEHKLSGPTRRAAISYFTMNASNLSSAINRNTPTSTNLIINHMLSYNTDNSSSTGSSTQAVSNSYSPLSTNYKTITQPSSLQMMIFQSTEEHKHLEPTSRAEMFYFTRDAIHMSSTSKINTVPSYATVTISHLLSNSTKTSSSTGSSSQPVSNSYSPFSAILETISQPSSVKTMIFQSTEENKPSEPTSTENMSYFTRSATHMSSTNYITIVPSNPTVTISHLLLNSTQSSSSTGSSIQPASNSYTPLSVIHNSKRQPSSLQTILFQSTQETKHIEQNSRAEMSYFTRNATHVSSTSKIKTVSSYPAMTISHLLLNNTESSFSTGPSSQSASKTYSPLSAIFKTISQPSSNYKKTTIFQSTEEDQTSETEISDFTRKDSHMSSTINRNSVPFYPTVTMSHLLSDSKESSSSTGSSTQPASNSYSPLPVILSTISKPSNKHSEQTSKTDMFYFIKTSTHMSSHTNRNTVPSYPTLTNSNLLSNSTESSSITGSSTLPASKNYSPVSAIHNTISQPPSLKMTIFQRTKEYKPSESTSRAEISYITGNATGMLLTNNINMVTSYPTVTNNTGTSVSTGSISQSASNNYPPLSVTNKSINKPSLLQTMILQSTEESKHSESTRRAEIFDFTMKDDTSSTSNRNTVPSTEATILLTSNESVIDPISTESTEKSTKIRISPGTGSSNSDPSAIETISQHASTNAVKHVNTDENSKLVTTEYKKILHSTVSISQPINKSPGTSHSIISHHISTNTMIPSNIKSSSYTTYTTFTSNQGPSLTTEPITEPISTKGITYNSTEQSRHLPSTKNTRTSHSSVTISNHLLSKTWISSSVGSNIKSPSISYMETFPSTETLRQTLSITSAIPRSKEGNKDLALFNTTVKAYPTKPISDLSSFKTYTETPPSEVNKKHQLSTSISSPSSTETSNQSVSTSNIVLSNSTKATSEPPTTKSVTSLIREGNSYSVPSSASETIHPTISVSQDFLTSTSFFSAIINSASSSTIVSSYRNSTIIQTSSTKNMTSPGKKENSHLASTDNDKSPTSNITNSNLLSTTTSFVPTSQSSTTSIIALSNTSKASGKLPSTNSVSPTYGAGKYNTLLSNSTERTHPAVSATEQSTKTDISSANGTIIHSHSVSTSKTLPFHAVGTINQSASTISVAFLSTEESKHSKSSSNTETPMLKVTDVHLLPTSKTISSSSGSTSQSTFKSNTPLLNTTKTTSQLSGTETTYPIVSIHHFLSEITGAFPTLRTTAYYDFTSSTIDSHSVVTINHMSSTKRVTSPGENESNHSTPTYNTETDPTKVTISNMLTTGMKMSSISGLKSQSTSTSNKTLSNITEATSQQPSTKSVTTPSTERINYSEKGKTYSTISTITKYSSSTGTTIHSASPNNILLSHATEDTNQAPLTKHITSLGIKGNVHSATTNNIEANSSQLTNRKLFSTDKTISSNTRPISQSASTISMELLKTIEATNQLPLTTRVTTPNKTGNNYSDPANGEEKSHSTVPISNVLSISTRNYSSSSTTAYSGSTIKILPSHETGNGNQITLTKSATSSGKKENFNSATTKNNKTTHSKVMLSTSVVISSSTGLRRQSPSTMNTTKPASQLSSTPSTKQNNHSELTKRAEKTHPTSSISYFSPVSTKNSSTKQTTTYPSSSSSMPSHVIWTINQTSSTKTVTFPVFSSNISLPFWAIILICLAVILVAVLLLAGCCLVVVFTRRRHRRHEIYHVTEF